MAANRRRLTDTFKSGFCCVCGLSDVNQYYGINESYIDYCGNFPTFKDVLIEVLNFNTTQTDETTMEICQDCKDKLVKFYHFKRKAQEVQSQFKLFQLPTVKVTKNKTPQTQQNSQHKAITNIYQVEDLTTGSSYEEEKNHKETSSKEPFKIESAVSLNTFNDIIEIKEELEEPPNIVFEDYSSDFSAPEYPPITQPQKASKNKIHSHKGDASKPLSKAAMKMRLYRERLKLPENRARFLVHQQQQREYNRRHYMRKQGVDLRRKRRVNYSEELEDMFITPDSMSESIM